jgi:type II secretory pathway pseudopilin PulG
MKTKRRQELKSNDLAAWLEDVSKSASQWGGWVLGGLAVIIIVVFISRYRTNARLEARSEAFSALRTASSMQVGSMTKTPEEIRTSLATIDDLIAETPDNDFKIEALLGKADLAMSLARRALGGDETAKVDDPQAVLDDARAAYERGNQQIPGSGGLSRAGFVRVVPSGDARVRGRPGSHPPRDGGRVPDQDPR